MVIVVVKYYFVCLQFTEQFNKTIIPYLDSKFRSVRPKILAREVVIHLLIYLLTYLLRGTSYLSYGIHNDVGVTTKSAGIITFS